MNTTTSETGFAARLLHGAKDLIWQADPTTQRPAAITKPAPATQRPVSAATSSSDPATDPNPALQGMSAELLTVVMNRPTAYSALTEAITALAEIPMDEATRYRSAFAVLKKTQQRTVEQISQAVEVHLGVLETEIARFSSQSKGAEDSEISSRIHQIATLNAAVEQGNLQIATLRADTEARITQLQEEASKKQARASELGQETEQKKRAILQTTQGFEAAIDAVKGALAREKAKIQQYLA